MEILRQAVDIARDGRPVALVTVISTSGSTPRHAGARMLVLGDGSTRGTIGGGRVEQEVTSAGAEVARGAEPRRVRHHLVRDLAMCCGGTMEVYLQPVAPSAGALERALDLWQRRRPAVLVTPLCGAPARVEERSEHGGAAPGLEGERFIEPLFPRERLILFGCGHVARRIGPLAAQVGFEVIACDDDETGAISPEPPWADRTVASFEVADLEREIGGLGAGDYAVIVTRDHAIDQRILERLLPNESLSYLGVIGSRGKIGRFKKRLAAKEIATPARWERLRAPIGLDIAAETPEEIAVSVVAELISTRNRGRIARR